MTELRPDEILDRAADEIMIRGREQGTLYRQDTGEVCALGGIALAEGYNLQDIDSESIDLNWYSRLAHSEAVKVFGEYLESKYPGEEVGRRYDTMDVVYSFNDAALIEKREDGCHYVLKKFKYDIIDEMRACAKELREKEQQ